MIYTAAQPTSHRRDRYVGMVLEHKDGMSRAIASTDEDYATYSAALEAAKSLKQSMLTALRHTQRTRKNG